MLIYMRMLNRRVHLLLEEETYKLLRFFSKKKGVSMGELIRSAINREYKERASEEAITKLLHSTPIRIKGIDIRKLREAGRRY